MEDSRKGIDRRHMPPQGIMLLLSYKAKVNPWTHGVNSAPVFDDLAYTCHSEQDAPKYVRLLTIFKLDPLFFNSFTVVEEQ